MRGNPGLPSLGPFTKAPISYFSASHGPLDSSPLSLRAFDSYVPAPSCSG